MFPSVTLLCHFQLLLSMLLIPPSVSACYFSSVGLWLGCLLFVTIVSGAFLCSPLSPFSAFPVFRFSFPCILVQLLFLLGTFPAVVLRLSHLLVTLVSIGLLCSSLSPFFALSFITPYCPSAFSLSCILHFFLYSSPLTSHSAFSSLPSLVLVAYPFRHITSTSTLLPPRPCTLSLLLLLHRVP